MKRWSYPHLCWVTVTESSILFGKLFLLFAILPIVEIALLINVGEQIGGWNTVALVILTAFIGAYLVRKEGLATLFNAQRKLNTGAIPGQEMAEGLLLVIAGVLLVTPGFITDGIGFLFSLPFTRPVIARFLMKHVKVQGVTAGPHAGFHYQQQWSSQQPQSSASDEIIEGEFVRTDRDDARLPDSDQDKK